MVDTLKTKVKFPVKWAMEVINEGAKKEDGEQNPKLVTIATSVEVKEVDKAGLAYPPAGFAAATGPYVFGDGKQTATEDLLGKVPPKPGKPPKDVDQATDDKEPKKTK